MHRAELRSLDPKTRPCMTQMYWGNDSATNHSCGSNFEDDAPFSTTRTCRWAAGWQVPAVKIEMSNILSARLPIVR